MLPSRIRRFGLIYFNPITPIHLSAETSAFIGLTYASGAKERGIIFSLVNSKIYFQFVTPVDPAGGYCYQSSTKPCKSAYSLG